MKKISVLFMTLCFLAGCAHIISQNVREQVDRSLTPDVLFKTPELYKGKMVILGGTIISAKNTEKGTYIEVLQKPLDYRGRPEETDVSYGRFIVFHEEYLDAAIYLPDKDITIAGTLLGTTLRPLGEIDYPYLLIRAQEIHLFGLRSLLPIQFSIGVFSSF